jgi:hypothetical protein
MDNNFDFRAPWNIFRRPRTRRLSREIVLQKNIKYLYVIHTVWIYFEGKENFPLENIEALGSFLTSALDGGEWSASRPGRSLPREMIPSTYWTGGWVDVRVGLNEEATGKILCLCRGSNPDRPVIQSVGIHCTEREICSKILKDFPLIFLTDSLSWSLIDALRCWNTYYTNF